jgi:hypothetical protein
MLSQDHAPIGKLKQAFGLNTHDVQSLLSMLLPDGVFPANLWKKAYSSFWFGKIQDYRVLYKLDSFPYPYPVILNCLSFPNVIAPKDEYYYITKSMEMMHVLFVEICSFLSSDKVKIGLDYIIEESYDLNISKNVFYKECQELFEKLTIEDKNFAVRFASCIDAKQFIETIDDKRRAVSHKYFSFISKLFLDTIVVKKHTAIRYLLVNDYSLKQEVKGISRALVERIAASMIQSTPLQDTVPSADLPAEPELPPIIVPAELWQGKTPAAIRDAMKQNGHDEMIIAYVLHNWCKRSKKEVGELLRGPKDESAHRYYVRSLLKKATAFNVTSS